MEQTLEQQRAVGVRYAGLVAAVIGVTIGTGAATGTPSFISWLALLGAVTLVALVALREMLANDLGVQFRTSPHRGAGPAIAGVLERRLQYVDRALLAFVVLFTLPLVVAAVSG